MKAQPSLPTLLAGHRATLLRFVERQGSGLLAFEAAEDLVQGIHLLALEGANRFRYEGERQFVGWLRAVARQHIARRHRFWSALRRNPRRLVRLTLGSSSSTAHAVRSPIDRGPGPATVAGRNEDVALAVRALAVLLPRDQALVRWTTEDVPIETIASRLEISPESAARARHRALARFRDAHAALAAKRGGSL